MDLHLISCRGPVRSENQDAGSAWRGPGGAAALVVSDGMGGHAHGREAARLVVRECLEALRSRTAGEPWESTFAHAVERAQSAVRSAAARRVTAATETGMGATVALAAIEPREDHLRLHTAHVGDSRVYLYRGRSLYRLTADHSQVARMVRDGWLDDAQAFVHPDRNVLQRAVGQHDPLEPEIGEPFPLEDGDLVLVCSDGLHGAIPDTLLAEEIGRADDGAETVCRALVEAALEAGSDDNVTVGCARLERSRRPRRPTRTQPRPT